MHGGGEAARLRGVGPPEAGGGIPPRDPPPRPRASYGPGALAALCALHRLGVPDGLLQRILELNVDRVASANTDKTIRVWRVADGECERVLEGHTGEVQLVIALGKGRLVSGSRDGSLRVWRAVDLEEGVGTAAGAVNECCEHVLLGHDSPINSMVLVDSFPGQGLVSGARNGSLVLWDLAAGVKVRGFECGHNSEIHGLVYVAPGRVVSSGSDSKLRVWSLQTGGCVQVLEGHLEEVLWVVRVEGADVGGRVVSASRDGTLRSWRLDRGECESVMVGHTRPVFEVIDLGGGRVASGSVDSQLRVWRTRDAFSEAFGVGHQDTVFMLSLSDDRKRIISSSYDCDLRVWKLGGLEDGEEEQARSTKMECEHVLRGHQDPVVAVVCLGSSTIVSASFDGTVRLWCLETGECLKVMEGHLGMGMRLAVVELE